MKLTEQQAKILATYSVSADRSVSEIAEQLKMREHVVRNTISSFIARKLITPRWVIDVFKLGLSDCAVYLRLSSFDEGSKNAILATLEKSEKVPWIGEMMGDYQLAFSVIYRDIDNLKSIVSSLLEKLSALDIHECQIAPRVNWTFYPTALSGAKKPAGLELRVGGAPESPMKLDEVDFKILEHITLMHDDSMSRIAKKLGIPESTCTYRFAELKRKKVIVGKSAEVNAMSFGLEHYNVLIFQRKYDAKTSEGIGRFLGEHPNVFMSLECVASWTREVAVIVPSPAALKSVLDELYQKFGAAIHSIKICRMTNNRKVMFYPSRLL